MKTKQNKTNESLNSFLIQDTYISRCILLLSRDHEGLKRKHPWQPTELTSNLKPSSVLLESPWTEPSSSKQLAITTKLGQSRVVFTCEVSHEAVYSQRQHSAITTWGWRGLSETLPQWPLFQRKSWYFCLSLAYIFAKEMQIQALPRRILLLRHSAIQPSFNGAL